MLLAAASRYAPLVSAGLLLVALISLAPQLGLTAQGIDTALIDPGKPWQNGAGESFNGKFRDECLSLEWFRSRAEAKAVIEAGRVHFSASASQQSRQPQQPQQP